MKLFDGSGEYVAADTLCEGDEVRREGVWRVLVRVEVFKNEHNHSMVRVGCTDGHGFECSTTERVLKKTNKVKG